jgi:hypothetical protein
MSKSAKQYIESDYTDIISPRNSHNQIDFEKFITRHFNLELTLIDNNDLTKKLKKKIGEEYGDIHKTYFIKYGYLETIPILTLQFYQPFVGIDGPYYHSLNDPVFVIKEKDRYILWEGYHRVLSKILDNENLISCYILSI